MASLPSCSLATSFERLTPGGAQLALVLAGLGDRAGDVGRDVLRVLARDQLGRASTRSACRCSGRSGCSCWDAGSGRRRCPRTCSARSRPGAPAGRPRRGSAPSTPVVPARLRVWQEPHLATKFFLPATRLSPSSLSSHPDAPTNSAAAATMASPLPFGIGAESYRFRGRAARPGGPPRRPRRSARRRPTSSARA